MINEGAAVLVSETETEISMEGSEAGGMNTQSGSQGS
jgi:hypothetical protein